MKRKLMKQLPLLALALVATIIAGPLTSASSLPVAPSASGELYAPDRILVRLKPGVGAATIAGLHRAQGAVAIREIPQIRVQVLRVPANQVLAKVAAYSRDPNVLYAEPDYTAYALEDPDDTDFSKQWGLDNDGQEYKSGVKGTVDADVDASEAWDITTGTADVKIAILDSGIDQDHPDLNGKLALADNVNFTDSSTWDDLYGHGTHVAGIAAAETNNAQGVAGVGYNSSLMNVKVLNDQGFGSYSWIASGIVWATDNGAKVINMSLGRTPKSSTLEDAVNYAWREGVVLAAAAGNTDNPSPTYPAKYENCIAVAATDSNDQKAGFSSYGSWVDVAAPGLDIWSTFPNHPNFKDRPLNYGFGSGTSMSTPHVAGLAALVWATKYGSSNSAVRHRIEATCDAIPGTGEYWIHGRINACNAVGGSCSYGGAQPPPPPEGTMHVAAIDMWYTERGPNYFVYTKVTIVDESGDPVSDATVYLKTTLPDGSTVSDSGITGSDGAVTFSVKSQQTETYISAVTNVTHASLTYYPADNVETSESLIVP